MKKIIFILCMFFFMKNVCAIEKCGNSSKTLWYKLEEQSKYFRLQENESDYPLLDKNSFYKTDFTNWINVEPEKKAEREVETKKIYVYQDMYPIQYLFLHNFTYSSDKIKVKNIEVVRNEKEEKYKLTCIHCVEEKKEYILKKDSVIKLQLEPKETIENIKINIEVEEENPKETKWKVTATAEDTIKDAFYHQQYVWNKNKQDNEKTYKMQASMKTLEKRNLRYGEEKRSEREVEPKANRKIKEEVEYRYRDTFYRYYQVIKIYDIEKKAEGSAEYPYQEVGLESLKQHCFQNKIITLKNKISKIKFSPTKKIPKHIQKIEKDKSTQKLNLFFPLILTTILTFPLLLIIYKKKIRKLVNPQNE